MAKPKREELEARVISIVEPLLAREGYELVQVELTLEQHIGQVLRLFIDKPGGVTLDDCASVSEAVGTMLDVDDPIETAYNLEVSSPGLDRPLRKPSDFQKFLGKKAKLKTYGPIEGAGSRKVFVGPLVGFENDAIKINVDGTVYSVPREALAKANLVFEFEDE